MANTKITSRVIADGAVGIFQLDTNTDPIDGQALTYNGNDTNLGWTTISVPQTLTVIGRSANVDINITSGTLVVEGRAGNVNVGV